MGRNVPCTGQKGAGNWTKVSRRPDISTQEDLANREAKLLNVERLLNQLIARAPNEVAEAGLARRLARDKKEPVGEKWVIPHYLVVEHLAIDAGHHQVAQDRIVVTC